MKNTKKIWLVYTFSEVDPGDAMNLYAVCDSRERAEEIKEELYWEDITDVRIEVMELNKANL